MSRALPRPRPGRPFLRRSATSLQIGLDPAAAVVVDRLTPDAARALLHLDGTLARHDVVTDHPELGPLLDTLHGRGLLLDDDGRSTLSAHRQQRSAADLAAMAAEAGTAEAHRTFARRSRATVAVRGNDRAAALIATGLAAAGIGTVHLQGPDRTTVPADITPAGPYEPGASWREQMSEALRRLGAHPAPTSTGHRGPAAVALVSAADVDLPWTDPELGDDLLSDGVPHLAVAVAGASAHVGPFVLPGRSACLWCLDQRRRDQDAAWPGVADQIRLRHHRASTSLGTASAAAAALAVAHLLQLVDDPGAMPLSVDAQLILRSPDLVAERVRMVAHPVCGCGWAATTSTMVG